MKSDGVPPSYPGVPAVLAHVLLNITLLVEKYKKTKTNIVVTLVLSSDTDSTINYLSGKTFYAAVQGPRNLNQ